MLKTDLLTGDTQSASPSHSCD